VDRLQTEGIIVRNLPGSPYVRASVGAWSSEDELDRLVELS
jgi:selenocysteine lyase/cysteine desulfurase